MHVLHMRTGVDGYQQLINHVRANGVRRTPRGITTLDVGPMTIIMHNVTQSLPIGIGRNLNRGIAAAEAIQLIGGFSKPSLLLNASENFKNYVESDGTFHGAYGDRIGNQLIDVIAKLRNDSDTRQAVITLWNPTKDFLGKKRDYPCTVAMNFAIVDDVLNMNVIMRSQDVWMGAPYDWFQFTQLMQTVANILGVRLGAYMHTTWSTHIYERNLKNVDKLTDPPPYDDREWQPCGLGWPGDNVRTVRTYALMLTESDALPFGLTDSEKWYHEQLTPLMG